MTESQVKKEVERLAALRRHAVLDTPPDDAIDSIAKAAAEICQTPIALVSLVDESRQWFKAALGVPITETPREHSFCSHAIEEPEAMMVIEDATQDNRFKDNPLVTGEPNIRFYSGKPLISADGHALGTLCVIDDKPRQLSKHQENALSRLADAVTNLLSRQDQSMSAAISLAVEQALQLGVTITDPNQPDNPMVYVNKAFESLTGYSRQELLGRNCRFLQGDNTAPDAIEELRNAVLEHKETTVALKNNRKDGSEFWNEVTVSPIVDKLGVTTHFIGIQKDVSERYKTEAALSQSQAFIESAPDAMVISNQAGEIQMANTETVRLFGYTQKELSQLKVDTLIAEKHRENHEVHRQRFLDKNRLNSSGSSLELFGLTKDGKDVPIDVRASPVVIDGDVLVSASMRDVSAKFKARAELRKSQDRYRDLFENSSDLIQSINPDGTFSYTNPAWLKAFGYTQQEVSKLWIGKIVYPDNYDHCQNVFDQVMAGESIPHVEVVFMTKSGDPVYLEGSVSTNVVDGEVTAIRTIFRDVTERNKTEKLLIASKESAETATEAKSRFLAAASHDLRQPLQSANMYVATLARQLDNPDEAKELCNMAGNSLNVMGHLLDVLLDITKLDAGTIIAAKQDVPIRQVLENIVTSSQQQAEQKGLKFSCDYQDHVVHTDPVLLERIVENFVSNAIRYTEQGEVKIECSDRGDAILIGVSDSGVGIPLNKQSDIFEEYYQLDNQARDRSKGLGLGLSIVKRIAGLLDHSLTVSSELGKGSSFSVAVPLGTAALLDQPAPEPNNTSEAVSPVILLVDDDEYVLKSTARLLRTYEMIVHTAINGDDALALISNGLNPDFLISDFRLPHYDGIELVHRIRNKLSRDLPTAIITGDTSTPKIKQAQLANFAVLYKPIDLQRLLGLINDRGQ